MSRLQRVALWAWILLPSTAGAHGIHVTTLDGDLPHEGVMFDVTALADLDMNALGVNLPTAGTHLVDLWVRKGTHRGHETDPSAWTFVGGAVVETQGPGIAARIPMPISMEMTAGEVTAFYVEVVSNGSLLTSAGSRTGAVHTEIDGEVRVEVGTGLDDHFGRPVPARIFNGELSYIVVGNVPPFGIPQEVRTKAGTPVAITLAGYDANDDPVTPIPTTGPSHGTLQPQAPPTWLYTPARGFSGRDSFQFATSDGTSRSPDEATVVIDVEPSDFDPDNGLPVADAGGPYRAAEGAPLDLDGSGSHDPDGRIVEWRWDCDGDGSDDVTRDQPFGRTCTWYDDGAHALRLTVIDDRRGVAMASAVVLVENAAPVVSLGLGPVVDEGAFAFRARAVDPGTDDVLAYEWTFGDGTGATTPDATHVFTRNGRYEVSVKVTDGDGGEAVATLTIDVTDAPTPECPTR